MEQELIYRVYVENGVIKVEKGDDDLLLEIIQSFGDQKLLDAAKLLESIVKSLKFYDQIINE